MKHYQAHYMLLLITLFPVFCFSQDTSLYGIFPGKNGTVYYELVVDADTTSKDELFRRATLWALNAYKSQKDANQIADREAGILAYNGFTRDLFKSPKLGMIAPISSQLECWHNLKILVKDGRAKVIVTEFEYRYPAYVTGTGTMPAQTVRIEQMQGYLQTNLKSMWVRKGYYQEYWKAMLTHFERVDASVTTLISSVEKALTSETNEFDF